MQKKKKFADLFLGISIQHRIKSTKNEGAGPEIQRITTRY